MSKVSVVIPVYNVENYLGKCIESVTNQTEKDIEIILVDDGSTDNSPAICDEYAKKDNRIKVIHKENSGPGDSRNLGIKTSTSEFILLLDSDDYLENNAVEAAYSKITEADADIVIFRIRSVNENGDVLADFGLDLPNEEPMSLDQHPELILINPSPCNKMFRRKLFEKTPFENAWYEDLRTIPKLYVNCSKIVQLNSAPLYNYLTREGSRAHNGNVEKSVEKRIDAVDSVINYYKDLDLFNRYKEELEWLYIFHGYFLPCREIMHFTGDWKTGMKQLRENAIKICAQPEKNKYFNTLSKKEKMMFKLFFAEQYTALALMLKIKR